MRLLFLRSLLYSSQGGFSEAIVIWWEMPTQPKGISNLVELDIKKHWIFCPMLMVRGLCSSFVGLLGVRSSFCLNYLEPSKQTTVAMSSFSEAGLWFLTYGIDRASHCHLEIGYCTTFHLINHNYPNKIYQGYSAFSNTPHMLSNSLQVPKYYNHISIILIQIVWWYLQCITKLSWF